ncbi:RNA polymerase sigma factor [Pedobacter antarcticus]|uniref:RNA polymerase sigma factor n=1 Tax=Pedobacter antarcticus TaxID=34086 RepID=UPI001C56763D|nr:sigma-70 family RNA polymerase sigma factor [Pedobacter antarcticus]
MQQPETDSVIIAAILNGQTGRYTELVSRHQRYVFTLAMRFTKNREEAEEVAQDCFVKAYRALGTFKQDSKFSTWLYSITYTTAMTYLRKKKLDTQSIDEEGGFIQLENHISAYTANGAMEKQSGYHYLNKAISMLSPDDNMIVTLFYQGEQSLEEIGQTMNMTANTVKVKLHRARIRLKEKLQGLLKNEVNEMI